VQQLSEQGCAEIILPAFWKVTSTFRRSFKCWWPHLGLGAFQPPASHLEFLSCELILGGEADSPPELANS